MAILHVDMISQMSCSVSRSLWSICVAGMLIAMSIQMTGYSGDSYLPYLRYCTNYNHVRFPARCCDGESLLLFVEASKLSRLRIYPARR